MKKMLEILLAAVPLVWIGCVENANRRLADRILNDTLIDRVEGMARELVSTGLNAGDRYHEVWIRDYNTFIELAMEVMPDSVIRDNLLTFFRFQGPAGDIVDGFVDLDRSKTLGIGYNYRYSALEPRYAAHKNTVETDQESSLVQAVWRYVKGSGNHAFLQEEIDGKTVLERLEWALEYLLAERYNEKYGLLWGATTADWGDIQPEHSWGTEFDENSHSAIDIYDNALFIIAIDCFMDLAGEQSHMRWIPEREGIAGRVREHLWDPEREKFIPHIYLEGSPFPTDFDENQIYYHGGTAVAVEAGLLTRGEIETANARMLANVEASGAPTIGLTLYPPYPQGFFRNTGMNPYQYQNGGDWTWFGARMIRQLVCNGFVQEAYDELQPMLERTAANNAFHEWYARDGAAMGSGSFRGEAGVLWSAIRELRIWARQQ